MPLVPAFLLMAQAASSQTVEVPILYSRPSRIVKVLQNLPPLPLGIQANDEAGTLTLCGSLADISQMKMRINLFDVEAKKVDLDLKVVSPVDHAEWKAQLTMMNNRPWTGNDDATGVELKVVPRLNDDGTVTVFLDAKNADHHVNMVFRSKLNETVILGFKAGKWIIAGPHQGENGQGDLQQKDARIIIKYVDRPKG